MAAVIAAVHHYLHLIPGIVKVLVGQRAAAHSVRSVGDIGLGRSSRQGNRVEPGTRFTVWAVELLAAALQVELLRHLPCLHELPKLGGVHLIAQVRRPIARCPRLVVRQELSLRFGPPVEGRDDVSRRDELPKLGRGDDRPEAPHRDDRRALHFSCGSWGRCGLRGVIQLVQIAAQKFRTPGVDRVHPREPMVPVGQLQGDGNLAWVQIPVGTECLLGDPERRCLTVRFLFWSRRSHTAPLFARTEEKRERSVIAVERPGEPGAGCPVRHRLSVQPRARLVRWIPRTAGIGDLQGPDVACDLLALDRGKPVKSRSRDDGLVGEVEVLEIPSVLSVAVGAMRLNGRSAGRIVGDKLSAIPEASTYCEVLGVATGRSPRIRILLNKGAGG